MGCLISSDAQAGQRSHDVLIWIDTLCVPLGKGRKNALRLMGQTYTDAVYVLAPDQNLCDESLDYSTEEICIRLFLCPWARRLWNFKEGFLAESRLFV